LPKNNNLIKARKENNYTQEELANKVGCKKTTISNWENGIATPKLHDAYILSQILKKDIGHLFFSNEVQENHTKIEVV